MKDLLRNKFEIILCFIILGYIVLFSFLSIHRMYALNSHYYDLGIMNQTVYNTSRGWFLEMSNLEFGNNISRMAVHFDPILALIAPLYWFISGPETLLILQTLVLASGALAVYLISQKIIKEKLMSLIFAVSYLGFFQVGRANLFDFHAVTLATGFLLWMIYFSLQKKWILTLIFVFLAILTKEHVGLIIFLYGIYLFFIHKEKKIGLIIGFLGIVFFVLATFVIIPYFRGSEHFALKYYSNLNQISLTENRNYLTRLFFSNLSFMIFAPFELLISLPEILINTISSNSNMRGFYFHYSSLIIPFIFFSSIYGAARIQKSKLRHLALFIFIILSLNSIYKLSPLPLKFLEKPYYYSKINHAKLDLIKKWQINLKDDQIKISTTPKLAPFFTNRRYFYNYDATQRHANISKSEINSAVTNYNRADYVIINRDEIGDLNKNNVQTIFYKNLLNNSKFEMIFNQAGIEVYKKI